MSAGGPHEPGTPVARRRRWHRACFVQGSMGVYAARDLVRVPGLLSLVRLPLAAVFPFVLGRPAWALAVLALAGASDVLDGWYARHFHQQTATGAVLDAVTDKAFVLVVAISLVVTDRLTLGEIALLGTRDIGEALLGLRWTISHEARRLTAPRRANVAGKIATALQYAAVIVAILGSDQRFAWVLLAGIAGLVAACAYWAREEG